MNGIIYESTDSWWTKHGATVEFWLLFLGTFAVIAWGMLQ